MSLPVLFHWTIVPARMQNSELPLALGIMGVDKAELDVLFTSTTHGVDTELQIISAVHTWLGCACEQA
jgi:hypothetical protein